LGFKLGRRLIGARRRRDEQ